MTIIFPNATRIISPPLYIQKQIISDYLNISYAAASTILNSQPSCLYLTTLALDGRQHKTIKSFDGHLNKLHADLYSPDAKSIFSKNSIGQNDTPEHLEYVLFDYHYSIQALEAFEFTLQFFAGAKMTEEIQTELFNEKQVLEKLLIDSEGILRANDFFHYDIF